MDPRPSVLSPPTDDAIEAIIQQATSAKPTEGRPLRDTRTQLFVGNLPYRVRWQDLKDLFRKAGTVLRADVSLGPDNRSRGYGTVLLATAEDAGRAVDMFNGYSWQTRVLEVRLDRLLPEHDSPLYPSFASSAASSSRGSPFHPPSSQLGSSPSLPDEPEYMSIYRGTDPNSSRNLFVGNLPFHCQWQDLKDLFRQAGTVLRADVALGPDGRSRGFGTVVFATEYDAERAVKMFNGFEYNNRILKVHYDKFSQASQPPTTVASPAVGTSSSQNHASFIFDYGPASGPSTPHEMYTNLQGQQQYQQAQILHQPQAQHYQEYPPPLQQRQHQLLQSPYSSQSSKLDVDSLTSSLASTQLSSKSPATRLAQPQKPSPISATTSSGSTTTSSSLSDHSRTSTSASSVSQSPIQPSIHHQQHTHSQQPSLQHHPNHPGPITLPPRRPPAFPGSPHTPSASGLSLSPLHHPGMVSPYHMYSSSTAVYQHHPQLGPITPHGLPPITPSMPPFYLPPSSHAMMQQQQHQLQNYSSASFQRRSFANAVGSAPLPPTSTASASSSSASAAADTQTHRVSQPGQQQFPHQNPFAANQAQAFMVPLPSPGLYGIPSQQPQPSPPIHQPHLRLNLSGIPTTFSPGVSMSPGTFYGRQRDGLPMPNANPFINAAVGAPVHLHSPEGMPIPPGHPGAMVAHGHHPPAMQPPTPNMSHGAYFYAMSGAKKGSPSAMEPKGYFDPMYFPASVAGGIGASTLANEILQDKVVGSSSLREGVVRGGKGKESEKDKDKEGGSNSSNTDSSDTAGGGDSGREGNTSHPRRRPKAVEIAPAGGDTSVASRPKEDATTVLRTRSVGHASKAETVPTYAHWQSDPNIRTAPALSEESAGSVLRQAIPLRLPSSPLLNRRTKTTGQIPQAVEDPTVTSLSPSTSIPPPQSPLAP